MTKAMGIMALLVQINAFTSYSYKQYVSQELRIERISKPSIWCWTSENMFHGIGNIAGTLTLKLRPTPPVLEVTTKKSVSKITEDN